VRAIALDVPGADDDEARRVCACGREAPTVGDSVRCPKCGTIRAWGVAVRGELVFPVPKRRAGDLTP
jgi:hypothetical protein